MQLDELDNMTFDVEGCTTSDTRDPDIMPFMADIIMYNVPFACDAGGGLYCYYKGKYHDNGIVIAGRLAVRLFKQLGVWRRYTTRKGLEIANLIVSKAKPLVMEPMLERVNMVNGVFHIDTGEFKEHSPEYRTTVQIPITYDPNATCPRWDQFLYEVLPYNGGPEYLRDIIALCMIPLTSIQKCIVLFGEGSNGKSVYLSGLQAAIGTDNISNLSLQSLTGSAARFNNVELLGKLVNIFADLPVAKIEDASNIKGLTGEDRLPMERKGKQPFFATPFCRLIFSCNNKVDSDDHSDGYKRRFINVPFTQTFEANPKVGLDLQDNLSSQEELSGLFNKLIPRFSVLLEDGLVPSQELSGIIENYSPIPKEYKRFLQEHVTADENFAIPSSAFYQWFSTGCTGHGAHSPQKTVQYIKSLFPGTKISTLTKFDGSAKYLRAYQGIRMSNMFLHTTILNNAIKYQHLETDKSA